MRVFPPARILNLIALLAVGLLCVGVLPASGQPATTSGSSSTNDPTQGSEYNSPLDEARNAVTEAEIRVNQAESELSAAQQRAQELSAELDGLAAAFESAQAHIYRMDEDLVGADDRVDAAEQAVLNAEDARDQQLRTAYMQPGADLLRTSGAFLFAPDARTALHMTALMENVASRRSTLVEDAYRSGRQIVADVSARQGISTGATASLRDLEYLTEQVNAGIATAQADAASWQTELDAAEQERAAAAARENQLTAQQGVGYAVLGNQIAPGIVMATIPGGTQRMACPVSSPNSFIDSWGFPRSGGRTHKGVDIFNPYGAPLYAAADGRIRRVFNNRLGGLSIDLVDVLGNRYYYAHLSAAHVTNGQQVVAGQVIGANGNSGNARTTPPHLHWQFHPGDGGPVNPYPLSAALCRN